MSLFASKRFTLLSRESPQPSPVLGLADLCYPLAMSLGFLVLQSSALGSHYGVRTHRVQRGEVTKKMNK